jgi:hypothetical protein
MGPIRPVTHGGVYRAEPWHLSARREPGTR